MERKPVARAIGQMQAADRRSPSRNRAADSGAPSPPSGRMATDSNPSRMQRPRTLSSESSEKSSAIVWKRPHEKDPASVKNGKCSLGTTVADVAAQALFSSDEDLIAEEALPKTVVEESWDPGTLLVITLSEAKHGRLAAGEIARPIHEDLRRPRELLRGGDPVEDGRRHVTHGG